MRFRKWIIPASFALAVATSGLVLSNCHAAAQTAGGVRVASYNIEWFSEDANPKRISNLKQIISEVNPNIIGLQEIQSKAALSQIFDDKWELWIEDKQDQYQEVAIAVQKPLKIESAEMVFKGAEYERAFPGNRDGLRVVVATPEGKKVTVYVLHQKSRSGGRLKTDIQRTQAAGLLADYIRARKETNVIVVGDMNDAPDDVSVNILETGDKTAAAGPASSGSFPLMVNLMDPLYVQDYVTFGLSDLFKGQALEPIVKGARSENERTRGIDYRYPQDLKVTQSLFDQIIVSPNLKRSTTKLPTIYAGVPAMEGFAGQARYVDNKAEYLQKGTLASDHLPVYVDLTLD